MTLTEFLLARIAEDEEAARNAASDSLGADYWFAYEEPHEGIIIKPRCHGRPDDMVTDECAHIARHDPARVLAECEAKRRIVEKAQRADAAFNQMINPASSAASFALTEVLGYLALPYADHPDYQEAWRA